MSSCALERVRGVVCGKLCVAVKANDRAQVMAQICVSTYYQYQYTHLGALKYRTGRLTSRVVLQPYVLARGGGGPDC